MVIIFLQHVGEMRKTAHNRRQLAWGLQLPLSPNQCGGAQHLEAAVSHM